MGHRAAGCARCRRHSGCRVGCGTRGPAAAPSSFLGEMATEAKRLATLPVRTFMEGMNRGSEQWQKAIEGEPIDVFGYKLPAAAVRARCAWRAACWKA